MGGPVHERLAAQDGPTAITRCSLPAIGVEGVGEVARLTVHVHILAIETRSALDQELSSTPLESLPAAHAPLRGEAAVWGEVVQLGSPERLIGVNVANSADQVLIEEPSSPRCSFSAPLSKKRHHQKRDRGGPGDMRHGAWNSDVTRAPPGRFTIGADDELIDGHRAKKCAGRQIPSRVLRPWRW